MAYSIVFSSRTKSRVRLYRKMPIISPGLIFVQNAFLLGLFSEGPVIGRNFAFENGFCLVIKTAVHGLIFGRAYYRKDICV